MRAEMQIVDKGGEDHVVMLFPAATQGWGKVTGVYVYDRPFRPDDPAKLLFEWHEPSVKP